MTGGVLVWCPFPSEEEARSVAGTLLDERLVACANILGPMTSLYRWQGELGEAREVGVLFKTSPAARAAMVSRLGQLHSYQTPAIMAWSATAEPAATASWLAALGAADETGK